MEVAVFAFGAALFAVLVAIAVVDFRSLIIPDLLNAALGAIGIGWAWSAGGQFPVAQLVFAAGLGLAFWLMREAFLRLRRVAALGLGDVKMAGACAMWFSPWNVPLFLFLTAISALLFVAARAAAAGALDSGARVPFGPFLGIGVFATWLAEQSAVPTFIPDRGF